MQYSFFKFIIYCFLLVGNLVVTLLIIHQFIEDPYDHDIIKYIWQVPVYMIFYFYYRLITRRMVMSSEFMYIEKANFFALIIITLIIFASKSSYEYSRSIIALFFLFNVAIPVWIYILKRHFMQFDFLREPIVVICDSTGQEDVESWFVKDNSFGFDISETIIIDDMSEDELHESIYVAVNSDRYYAAVISLANESTESTFSTVNYVMHHMRRVYVLPKISKLPLFNSEYFNSINHKGMALFVTNRLLNPVDKFIKAGFDKALSIGLALIFSPILLLLYLIVLISTKGHPIFKQRRVGQNGQLFNIYKFRTMRIDADKALETLLANDPQAKAEWEKEYKLKNDPRITKIGKFLRKTSLDELPQIMNVFQGKMSLVGPRPIVADEMKNYGEMIDYFKAVKPGMTGLWQVSGRNDLSYEERVQLDVWYVRNWSIELDIIILVKTLVIVLSKKGSY